MVVSEQCLQGRQPRKLVPMRFHPPWRALCMQRHGLQLRPCLPWVQETPRLWVHHHQEQQQRGIATAAHMEEEEEEAVVALTHQLLEQRDHHPMHYNLQHLHLLQDLTMEQIAFPYPVMQKLPQSLLVLVICPSGAMVVVLGMGNTLEMQELVEKTMGLHLSTTTSLQTC